MNLKPDLVIISGLAADGGNLVKQLRELGYKGLIIGAPQIVQEIFSVIRQLREAGTTILLVEQNATLALRTADRVYVLEAGRLTLTSAAAELLSDERIKQAYLGT